MSESVSPLANSRPAALPHHRLHVFFSYLALPLYALRQNEIRCSLRRSRISPIRIFLTALIAPLLFVCVSKFMSHLSSPYDRPIGTPRSELAPPSDLSILLNENFSVSYASLNPLHRKQDSTFGGRYTAISPRPSSSTPRTPLPTISEKRPDSRAMELSNVETASGSSSGLTQVLFPRGRNEDSPMDDLIVASGPTDLPPLSERLTKLGYSAPSFVIYNGLVTDRVPMFFPPPSIERGSCAGRVHPGLMDVVLPLLPPVANPSHHVATATTLVSFSTPEVFEEARIKLQAVNLTLRPRDSRYAPNPEQSAVANVPPGLSVEAAVSAVSKALAATLKIDETSFVVEKFGQKNVRVFMADPNHIGLFKELYTHACEPGEKMPKFAFRRMDFLPLRSILELPMPLSFLTSVEAESIKEMLLELFVALGPDDVNPHRIAKELVLLVRFPSVAIAKKAVNLQFNTPYGPLFFETPATVIDGPPRISTGPSQEVAVKSKNSGDVAALETRLEKRFEERYGGMVNSLHGAFTELRGFMKNQNQQIATLTAFVENSQKENDRRFAELAAPNPGKALRTEIENLNSTISALECIRGTANFSESVYNNFIAKRGELSMQLMVLNTATHNITLQ